MPPEKPALGSEERVTGATPGAVAGGEIGAGPGDPAGASAGEPVVLVLSGDPFAVESVVSALEDAGAATRVIFDWARFEGVDPAAAPPAAVIVHPSTFEHTDATLAAGALGEFIGDTGAPVFVVAAGGDQATALADRLAAHLPGVQVEALDSDRAALSAIRPAAPVEPTELVEPEAPVIPTASDTGARTVSVGDLTIAQGGTDGEVAIVHGDTEREVAVAQDNGRGEATRLRRSAITVVVVTVLLWLFFGRGGLASRFGAGVATTPAPFGGVTPPSGAPAGGHGAGGAAEAPAAAELAGRVTRADTNGSLAGVSVLVTGPSGPVPTITDGQGRWRVAGLRGGRYTVVATASRFVAQQVQVEVPEGRALENVNLSLDPESP